MLLKKSHGIVEAFRYANDNDKKLKNTWKVPSILSNNTHLLIDICFGTPQLLGNLIKC